MKRGYSKGSLATFIIGGVILTLVLVGGLYGLNRYNAMQDGSSDEIANEEATGNESTNNESEAPLQLTDPGDATNESEERGEGEAASSRQTQPATSLPRSGPSDSFFTASALAVATFGITHMVRRRSA